MRGSVGHVLAVCAALWGTASAACSANLLIDDYSTYSTHINDQNSWTSGKFPPQLVVIELVLAFASYQVTRNQKLKVLG